MATETEISIISPAGYLTEEQLAELLDVKVPTLRVWAATRRGPPRVTVARRPLYREAAFYEWLARQEQDFDAARRRPIRRGPTKRAA